MRTLTTRAITTMLAAALLLIGLSACTKKETEPWPDYMVDPEYNNPNYDDPDPANPYYSGNSDVTPIPDAPTQESPPPALSESSTPPPQNPIAGEVIYEDNEIRILRAGLLGDYDRIMPFQSNGLAEVQRGGKSGFINKFGDEVIPLAYDAVGSWGDGLCAVVLGDSLGFINETDSIAIPFEYSRHKISKFMNGAAAVAKDGVNPATNQSGLQLGIINTNGSALIPFGFYASLDMFAGGYSVMQGSMNNPIWFIFDNTGKELPWRTQRVRALYVEGDYLLFWQTDEILGKTYDTYGAYSKDGTVVAEPDYDSLDSLRVALGISDPSRLIITGGNSGLLGAADRGVKNANGSVIVPEIYSNIIIYSDIICAHTYNPNTTDIYDMTGQKIYSVSGFPTFVVGKLLGMMTSTLEAGTTYWYIDVFGNPAIEAGYDFYGEGFSNGLAVAKRDGQWYIFEIVKK